MLPLATPSAAQVHNRTRISVRCGCGLLADKFKVLFPGTLASHPHPPHRYSHPNMRTPNTVHLRTSTSIWALTRLPCNPHACQSIRPQRNTQAYFLPPVKALRRLRSGHVAPGPAFVRQQRTRLHRFLRRKSCRLLTIVVVLLSGYFVCTVDGGRTGPEDWGGRGG